MIDERVHERPIGMVDGRMAHKPYLLGQHDKVVVLEADVKVDWLSRYRARLDLFLFLVHDHVARSDRILLDNVGPVHEDIARLDRPRGGAAARKACARCKKRIEPLPRIKRPWRNNSTYAPSIPHPRFRSHAPRASPRCAHG